MRAFIATDRIAEVLDRVSSIVEYWKSAPYLLNFMDEYKIKSEVRALPGRHGQRTGSRGTRRRAHARLADAVAVRRCGRRNGRARWLIEDLHRHNASIDSGCRRPYLRPS